MLIHISLHVSLASTHPPPQPRKQALIHPHISPQHAQSSPVQTYQKKTPKQLHSTQHKADGNPPHSFSQVAIKRRNAENAPHRTVPHRTSQHGR
ncbi:hypothetical protein P153DRAFT_21991 [Dothidotthia symphoricarpi CBS 119687]|uniref:Uncharacterized protein n=1 Tax=Dothidotthia symphoricarpi CBS 119687 TaxID=1392245 RepID=A0A6A6AEP1_9PLEO|nr:uncharacterized protein P153DRAFT_21991 [Dothidotthia symphoricarpi CBS 119687]KAF2129575.1 hypothetical protein P153DRAFT_21991 [Dothidotthia symphoricarpi CBS 119687]